MLSEMIFFTRSACHLCESALPHARRAAKILGRRLEVVDIDSDDQGIVIQADMPGVGEDDVEITIAEGRMTISGERREHTETEEQHLYRSESRYGSFSRTIPIPSGACLDDVIATYRDGILEVRVPVDADSPAVRQVPITE